MADQNFSAEFARATFQYYPDTGVLIRLVHSGNAKAGSIAGCVASNGYVIIKVNGRAYKAHRLAWLIMIGEWPVGDIDHIDRDRANNRFSNLRRATTRENTQNVDAKSKNIAGLRGVSPHASKWRARIRIDNRLKLLGSFDTPELAHAAYIEAKRRLHPFGML